MRKYTHASFYSVCLLVKVVLVGLWCDKELCTALCRAVSGIGPLLAAPQRSYTGGGVAVPLCLPGCVMRVVG